MKRRDFLKNAAGVATVFGIALTRLRDGAMAAHGPADALIHDHEVDLTPAIVDDEFRYRGRKVQILRRKAGIGRKAKIRLAIDNKEQESHVFAEVGDGYGSHMLPFEDFRNPRDLAKALIDNDGTLYKL